MNEQQKSVMERLGDVSEGLAREGLAFTNERPTIGWVNKNDLRVDHSYQRDAVISKVEEIARSFSWPSFGVISVAKRPDGSMWVLDGQSRTLAARRLRDVLELPCVIHRLASVTEEARAFLGTNTRGKPVEAIAKFRAAVVAGIPAAVLVDRTLHRLDIQFSKHPSQPKQFKCISHLWKLAESSHEAFLRVIAVASEICTDGPISDHLVHGLTYLDRRVPGGLDNRALLARLIHVGGSTLDDAARREVFLRGPGSDREKACGTAVLETLNKGLRKRFEIA